MVMWFHYTTTTSLPIMELGIGKGRLKRQGREEEDGKRVKELHPLEGTPIF